MFRKQFGNCGILRLKFPYFSDYTSETIIEQELAFNYLAISAALKPAAVTMIV